MFYPVGRVIRRSRCSLNRLPGQSAMPSGTWRVAFARPVQAVQQCCPLTILVRAEEQDVFTTSADHPEGIFGDVLICVGPAIVDFFNQSVFRTSAVFPFFACVQCASTCFASHPFGLPFLNQHQDEPHFTRAA